MIPTSSEVIHAQALPVVMFAGEKNSPTRLLSDELLKKVFSFLPTLAQNWNAPTLVCKRWSILFDMQHPLKILKKGLFDPCILQGPLSAFVTNKDVETLNYIEAKLGLWMNAQLNLFEKKQSERPQKLRATVNDKKDDNAEKHKDFILDNLLFTSFDTDISCTHEEIERWIKNCKSVMGPAKIYTPHYLNLIILYCDDVSKFSIRWWREIYKRFANRVNIPHEILTQTICLAAVQESGYRLTQLPIKEQTQVVCLAAVQENGLVLEYVPEAEKTPVICLAAVQENGLALQYVPKTQRTQAVCLTAVKQEKLALYYVPQTERTESVYLTALNTVPSTQGEWQKEWNDIWVKQIIIHASNLHEIWSLAREIDFAPLIDKLVQYAVEHYLKCPDEKFYENIISEFGPRCQNLWVSIASTKSAALSYFAQHCSNLHSLKVQIDIVNYQGEDVGEEEIDRFRESFTLLYDYLNSSASKSLHELTIGYNDDYLYHELRIACETLFSNKSYPQLKLQLCLNITGDRWDEFNEYEEDEDEINLNRLEAFLSVLESIRPKVCKLGLSLDFPDLYYLILQKLTALQITELNDLSSECSDPRLVPALTTLINYANKIKFLATWKHLESIDLSKFNFTLYATYNGEYQMLVRDLWQYLSELSVRKLTLGCYDIEVINEWMLNPNCLKNLEMLKIKGCKNLVLKQKLEVALKQRPHLKYEI